MFELVGLIASALTLALVCGLTYCTLVARADSWLASDVLAMNTIVLIFGSGFIGGNSLVPVAHTILTEGPTAVSVLSASLAIAGLALLGTAAVLFVVLARVSLRRHRDSASVIPLSPQPAPANLPQAPQDHLAA